jgi:hypothetical protein
MDQATVGVRATRGRGWAPIAVWALLALFLDVFWLDLYDRLDILALLFPLPLWLAAVWLAGSIASRGFRRHDWVPALLLPAALLSVGVFQGVVGRKVGVFVRFQALRPHYRTIVRAIEAGETPPAGSRYRVEEGQSVRVVFPWPGGILDNWCGVVYDSSGLLRKASRSGPNLSGSSDVDVGKVRGWFGGDLRFCEPLGGDWFFCDFT